MSAFFPKVSVLTTVKNGEAYLSEAIESILNQTFQDFEYLILDDGSTDKTWTIIQQYARKDKRIKTFQNLTSLNIPRCRTFLVKQAKTDYVIWQDGDDISMPTRIEKQYAFMESHPKVGICGGYKEYFGSTKNIVRQYAETDVDLRSKIFLYSPLDQPVAIVRRQAIVEAGDYDTTLPGTEDLEMSFRLGQNYEFANIPDILLKYRESMNSAMHYNLHHIELQTLRIRCKYAFHPAYKVHLFDIIYNLGQLLSIYLIPKHLKIKLFHLIRDTPKISVANQKRKKLNLYPQNLVSRVASFISSF